MNLTDLINLGFDVETKNHALAILTQDFPLPLKELCEELSKIRIPVVELIQGGGGEARSTQRLRRALTKRSWRKSHIVIDKNVDGETKTTTSHEIDHVRRAADGAIALEIEWNNKDPFFDRDLENFQRLHAEGAISVGVIVTRGKSLQADLPTIILEWAKNHGVNSFNDLEAFGVRPTARQRQTVENAHGEFVEEWARRFANDKFGSSSTHWRKLQERIRRGVGSPCPLLLIGIPTTVVHQERMK